MKSYYKGIILAICGASLWGISDAVVQFVFSHVTINALYLVGLRLLGAGTLMTTFSLIKNRSWLKELFHNKKSIFTFIVFAIFGMGGSQLMCFLAIKASNAPTATVIQSTAPIFIIIYLSLRNWNWPKKFELIAILIAFTGAYILVTGGKFDVLALTPMGLFLGVCAAIGEAIDDISPGDLFEKYGTINIVGLAMLVAGIFFIPCYFIMPVPALKPIDIGAIIYIIIGGTMLGYTIYLASVLYISPSVTGMLEVF